MESPSPSTLPSLDPTKPHTYLTPRKCINDGDDVSRFLLSQAYRDIVIFLLQLNRSTCPRKPPVFSDPENAVTTTFPIVPSQIFPEPITKLQNVLKKLDGYLELAPPDEGPRRFGNVAFRTWSRILEDNIDELLTECLPLHLQQEQQQQQQQQPTGDRGGSETEVETNELNKEKNKDSLHSELRAYLLGSFGSKQRLDYGTGHELSFLAFLGCLWKLGVFFPSNAAPPAPSEEETCRHIVLGIIHPYLQLVRHIIKMYTLEPAGSHGVWGLDDHSFLPYIFGSAQLSRSIAADGAMSVEGSLESAPATGDIVKKPIVEKWRDKNLYFSAIGFINDVKTGPFWEHSPILFDISGVRHGWGKINKGMLKMYNAEVLSKLPVVQHFPFGSLFSWDYDPNAAEQRQTVHMSAQPQTSGISSSARRIGDSAAAPWTQTASRAPPIGVVGRGKGRGSEMGMGRTAIPGNMTGAGTQAPWAPVSRPGAAAAGIPYSRLPPTSTRPTRPTRQPDQRGTESSGATDDPKLPMPMTKAPWAK